MPRNKKPVILARLHSTLKTDNEVVNTNPLILFSQLILLAERREERAPYFEYELTNYAFLLFTDGMMRNGSKASLCGFLMKVIPNANLPTEKVQVNDEEVLLFQIKSLLFTKFSDVYKLYKKHLYSKYVYCYVGFDCCGSGPFTKDIQHKNRSGIALPFITFTSDEKCVKSQENVLDNQNSKAHFIAGLSNYLSQNRFQCVADADTTIVKIVVEYHS